MRTARADSMKIYRERLIKVFVYVQEHLADELTLETLAAVSHFSPYHFHRLFRAFTGETPNGFVTRLRVERAAFLLRSSPFTSLTEIAMKSGFQSSAVFSRTFKSAFGLTPSTYRKQSAGQDSKNGQIESKNGKESASFDDYVENVNFSSSTKESTMEATFKEMPSHRLAYVVHTTGYNESIGLAYERLCSWAGPKGLLNDKTKVLGIGLDDPKVTAPEKCRFYACVTVPEGTEGEGDIHTMDLNPGLCAVTHLEGPGEMISDGYDFLYTDFIPRNNYQPSDVHAFELYHNDPSKDPQGHFDMDICIPVTKL